MRICRITAAFVPPWRGLGPGPYELSRAQQELGHRVTVLTREAPGSADFDRSAGFEIRRIAARRSFTFSVRAALRFLRLHRREPFDVVHNHGESAIALLLLRRLMPLRVPVVSSVHIVRRSQYRTVGERVAAAERAARRKTLFYERLYFKLSDALAAVSGSLSREIGEEYGRTENVFTVYNGVSDDDFTAAGHRGIPGGERLLLFVGRLNGRKGEFDLVRAMTRVRAEAPGAKLLLVGEGPARGPLNTLVAELGLRDAVSGEPYLPRDELRRRYRAADLFVLPSFSEGLPKVLLEAMAAGTPVVVSDIPAHTELVSHRRTGYLFHTGDPGSLAEAILAALGDPERSVVAGNAAALVRERFTWPAVARRLDQVYNALIEQQR